MRSFWPLMRAYWVSESWKEAWALTAMIAFLTALSSKAGVWIAEASGELVSAIATLHSGSFEDPLAALLYAAGVLVALVVFKDIAFIGIRHLFSTTLHRKWRGWLDLRFNRALLDGNHTHLHLQHGVAGENVEAPPDNVDQRVQESIKGMTGGAIGLAMGVIGVTTSLFFVGQKLLETSTAVQGLEFLGVYGSVILALTVVAIYVPVNTYIAVKLGGLMERLSITMQKAEGSYRAELTTFLRRSFHVAAAGGEGVQQEIHKRLYVDIDRTWTKLNWVHAGYMSFELIYNFIAARIVAYGPGLLPYVNQKIDLKGYVTGAELVNSLIGQCSWFIHVMPSIATLKANARRITDLANAIENVQTPQHFYRLTGRNAFRHGTQHPVFGLTVRQMSLMHHGDDAKPFVTASNLRFRRGEWTLIKGESGSGKTSMIKALNGLWPYGEGDIAFPEGIRSYYAAQDVKLQHIALKRLVCLPHSGEDYTDAAVSAALEHAGLGEFVGGLGEETRAGTPWDLVLSGGQKQKLVLARILLQQPGILFLDEATAALDPDAKIAFHQALRDHCPEMTVISVMHEAEPPRSITGKSFYDSIVLVEDAIATKRPIAANPAPDAAALRPSAPTGLVGIRGRLLR
ncbi:ATP-binding cassette domain-containing protein [Mesorhizobium sp. NBSH29]|uniref:ABC transporter ATP-binding protein/permease n=1 Tax=Mesorhizobium sp. NBSH29 TaxID=2654249 RepID=UPI00189654FB|nr:ABC transporter ATP-binding protein/permease [Mesorhizobium sp. NBSH29]QPC87238.1 ATP-binding cassette domain-containing protein [Mesorhizobium sp. NBSH29]